MRKSRSKKKKNNKIRNLSTYIDGKTTKVEIYSKTGCPYCSSAKEFLQAYKPKIIEFTELSEKEQESVQNRIKEQTGKEYRTYPKIFIDNKFIGGFSDLQEKYNYMNPTFYTQEKKGWSLF